MAAKVQKFALVDLVPANLQDYPCCGIKSSRHEGRRSKHCWLNKHFEKGLRAKVLLVGDNNPCGYIEYVPGEYAWRGVEASGYMVIHCVWMQAKRFQGKGMGSIMVQACVEEATTASMNGVAVVCREGPWLAGSAMYLANGFEVADTAPPDYHLLVRKLNPSAANPAFKGHWEQKLKRYGDGLTIIRSDQCPYIVKFADDIARAAEDDYGIKPRIVELKSHREAQNAPTPYAVFSVVHNGRLLADHQISRTRFHNIMKTLH